MFHAIWNGIIVLNRLKYTKTLLNERHSIILEEQNENIQQELLCRIWNYFLILVAGLIVGSVYDLQISIAIVNQDSVFGMVCASFGEIFGWGMMAVFGTMAFRIAKKLDKMIFKILLIAFGCLVIGVSFYLIFADMNSSHNGFKEISNLPLRLILSAIIVGAISFASYKMTNTEDTKLLLCAWIILMIAYYVPLAINFITKSIIMRPRFRLISNGYETYSVFDLFEPWYKAGTGIAQKI